MVGGNSILNHVNWSIEFLSSPQEHRFPTILGEIFSLPIASMGLEYFPTIIQHQPCREIIPVPWMVWVRFHVCRHTLQEPNISPKNAILKMIFLFPRWDMLIPWRVFIETRQDFFRNRVCCFCCALKVSFLMRPKTCFLNTDVWVLFFGGFNWANYSDQTAEVTPKYGLVRESPPKCPNQFRFRNYGNLPRLSYQICNNPWWIAFMHVSKKTVHQFVLQVAVWSLSNF